MIAVGDSLARIVSLSAPVPQPTSNQRIAFGHAIQARNSRATRRLQRPTYGSYTSPLAQFSFCCGAFPWLLISSPFRSNLLFTLILGLDKTELTCYHI